MTTNPPPPENFPATPQVRHLDEFFHRKYEDVGAGDIHNLRQVATAEDVLAAEQARPAEDVHLPSPSYWPLLLSLALPIIGFGILYHWTLMVAGGVAALFAVFGWVLEPAIADDPF
jgi:cytochrome c oxidase subunit 1